MKHLIAYNESHISDSEINQTLRDICLDIQDDGFRVYIGNVDNYTETSYAKVNILKFGEGGKGFVLFSGSEVAKTIERLHNFMKQNGWSMWADIHLYTDYHYNNGVLDFRHLLSKRLEEFFNIFRNELETGRDGEGAIKSIKLQFERYNNTSRLVNNL